MTTPDFIPFDRPLVVVAMVSRFCHMHVFDSFRKFEMRTRGISQTSRHRLIVLDFSGFRTPFPTRLGIDCHGRNLTMMKGNIRI